MRVFIDCEFTQLDPYNKLISIALVDEDENYFYAELTDTYTLADCSEFVKLHVLPFLKGSIYAMTEYDCKLAICNWIEDRNVECKILADNPTWDLPHLNNLIKDERPSNLLNTYDTIYIPSDKRDAIISQFGFHEHNALDDAMIMKKVVLGY